MHTSRTYTLTVKFIDGNSETFEFEESGQKLSLEKMMSLPVLTLELDQRLLVIPTAHIKSIEVSPVPVNLPGDLIRKARRVQKKSLM
ncbi:MAG: hypothetical protein GXP53_10780 [Deltaproteobacteria bacterium]|nr:hypothetical protein [Deltaproteobacteria bacterium]